MRKCLPVFILLVFLATNTSYGKDVRGRFSGTITDSLTGKPLPGVSIYIPDVKVGESTDAEGHFSFVAIPEGTHLVEISHIGYASLAISITFKGDLERSFSLFPAIIENSNVVVTGVATGTALQKIPFQVNVIRKDELDRTASSNIIESMAHKPGITTLSTGPAISKPIIRGLGYNRILTINDGVRQEGQQWGDEHGIEIDESSVQKIELLKGPASLIYGSDAMAGVINIISNQPIPKQTMQVNAGGGYQSNNRQRSLYANWAGNKDGFNWNLYGSGKEAADYRNKYDGPVFNSKFNERNVGGYAGINGNWGFTHLLLSSFDQHTGIVEGVRDDQGRFLKTIPGGLSMPASADDFNSTKPYFPYQHIRHVKIASDNNIRFGARRLSFNVSYQQNRREEFSNPDDPNERALYFDLRTAAFTSQLHLGSLNGWKPSIGLSALQQWNSNKGLEQLIPDYHYTDGGIYLFLQKQVGKADVSGGVRYDIRDLHADALIDGQSTKGASFNRQFNHFSASLGTSIEASQQVRVKANIASAYRAPGIAELASNGAHEGTLRYEYGDNTLKPETSIQGDLGLEWNKEHFSLNVSGFYNYFRQFIFYRKLESVNGGDSIRIVDGNPIAAFRFNQQAAALYGGEVSLDIHPHPLDWLHIENSFSIVYGKFETPIEQTRNMPSIPAPRLLSEIRAELDKLNNKLKQAYVDVELDHNFQQDRIFSAYNTETASPAYTLINAGIGSDLLNGKGDKLLSIHFSVNNIFDVAYQNHLSRLRYADINQMTGRQGVFNTGRNATIKLRIPLVFHLK